MDCCRRIAAVIRRTEHHRVAAASEEVHGLGKSSVGNRRAVRIDEAERSKPEREKILRSRGEPFAERFTTLRRELEGVWQNSVIRCFRADWRIDGDTPSLFFLGGSRDCRRYIA